MKKEYQDETTSLTVNLLPPTLGGELQRLKDIEAALKDNADDGILAGLASIYASLTAATPSGELTYQGEAVPWPPSFDDCLHRMSRAAFDQWTEWVYEANPGWKPQAFTDAEQEKKVENASGPTPSNEPTT